MDPENAVEIYSLTKTFRLETKTGSKGPLGKKKAVLNENTVLDNISLKIKKGDVVGIVGRNGSGKSTLLKIIARIMEPDSGTVEINGKIASILELGMGFHPDMTGRENIYLKGELYGFSKEEIDSKIDNIIEYSGVKKYIDNPVRTYSSGMTGRLAFAIMVNVEADVMLVDEILSIGDVAFSAKAREHFRKLSKSGRTVIFVSHSLSTVQEMCNRGVWIEGGHILKDGPIRDVVSAYQREMSQSFEIVSDMAAYGVPEAQYQLALMYRDGTKTGRDEAVSEEWMRKAAEQGHLQAQLEYAEILYGKDGEESKSEAIHYYQAAANSGNNEAKLKIASIAGSDSYDKDKAEILEIYRQLAERGNPIDELRYGDLLLKTALGPKDKQRALEWFKKSADHLNCDAMYQLALMYRDGIGTPRNPNACAELLEKASQMGHQRSQFLLAEMYYYGKVIERNEKKAFRWYLAAAERGNEKAQYQIAVMYREGIGVQQRPEESESWFRVFAHANTTNHMIWAADALKYINLDTESTPAELYMKASKYRNPDASLQLGNMYKDGTVDNVEPPMAKEFLSKAGENWGWQMSGLADYYYRGIGGRPDYGKAFDLYRMLAATGDPTACYRLAIIYRNGKGVERNDEESLRWLKFAAERGHRDALALLSRDFRN